MGPASLSIGRKLRSWPVLATILLVLQAIGVLVSNHRDVRLAWNSIVLFAVLLIATRVSAQNALNSRQSIRSFWTFIAGGSALWAANQVLGMTYSAGRGSRSLNFTLSTSVLFLHTVLMLAALACLPHVKQLPERHYRKTLNSLLLLVFLIFVYVFFLLPGQYLNWNGKTILWSSILYFVGNIALALTTAVLAIRTRSFWRSIYLRLFWASDLYAFASLVSNLRVADNTYFPGVFDTLNTGAACIVISAAIHGRKLEPQLASAVLPERKYSHPNFLAMLTLTSVPLLGVWELVQAGTPGRVHSIRMFAVLVAGLLLIWMAFITEYLEKRKSAFDIEVAHDQLQLANERLQLAVQAGRAEVWDLDVKTGNSTRVGNHQMLFGTTGEPHTLKAFWDHALPDDQQTLRQSLEAAKQYKTVFSEEFRVLWPNGTTRWLRSEGKYLYSTSGEPERMLGITVDISRRKRVEDALQKSDEEFRLAFEAARLGWWVWNEETGHAILSEGTRTVLGLPSEAEVTLHAFLDAVHPEDRERVYRTWRQSLEGGTYYFVEYRVLWPDGTVHWVETRGRANSGSRGKLMQMVGVSMDVTERKRAEEAVRTLGGRLIEAQEQERMRIARELHDDICQRLALLGIELERLRDNPEFLQATLPQWADNLAQFTEEIALNLQALSHELHSSKLEILGAKAAMKSFCAEFADRHQVKIEFTSDSVSHLLSREASLCLYRVLQEALHNAVKHSGTQHFFVQLREEAGTVELTVRDSGVGFRPETAMAGGGLGLVSMRERINLVNGTISIESVPMQGTTITARVPLEETGTLRCAS